MEDYEYLWLLAGGNPKIGLVNNADQYVAQLVQSRTLFGHIPTDLAAVRAAMGAKLGGSSIFDADFDNDNDVDGADLSFFANAYSNGEVGVSELQIFAQEFGSIND